MARGIWVYLEHEGPTLERVSLELVGRGRALADSCGESLVGLVLGNRNEALAGEAARHGLDEVVSVEHPLLESYTTDSYVRAAHGAVSEGQPNIFLVGATPDGRDLAGRLAVRLRTGLTADCTGLEIQSSPDGALLLSEVTGFGGGIAAMIACKERRPQMATVRPGIFPVPEKNGAAASAARGKIRDIAFSISREDIRTRVLERNRSSGTDITQSKYLVVGGRGVRGDFGLLEKLAKTLGAEIGATRVAVDEGWISKERMVGQTGYATRPRVAIACGVSGALQFMVGIQNAEVIVAINTDPEAPIFEQADYCIQEDLFRVLPLLIGELSRGGMR